MDNSLSYADILKKTLQEATLAQPRLQAIELYPVCDVDSGHFLILAGIRKKEEGRRKRGKLRDGNRGRIFSQLGIRN